jgi:hypothetical protein
MAFVLGTLALLAIPLVYDEPAAVGVEGHGPIAVLVKPYVGNMTVFNSSPLGLLPDTFWGINIEPYTKVTKVFGDFLNTTDMHMIRWPGGSSGDGYNYTSNRITRPGGSTASPAWNTSAFVAWCRLTNCTADFQLPGEINQSDTAAYYVRYVENTLGFHPAFWEIGNEPGIWTHYNIPWSKWATYPGSRITPMGYAQLVQRYISAVRGVDPNASFLGLPGVGTGSYREALWIYDTVQVNGPNLTGVGIHAYPAGRKLDINGTLAQFYATLNGTGSLSHRIPLDRAAISSACPSCANLTIYVTETGSGTDLGGSMGGTIATAMGAFPQVPYIAAMAIQGMNLELQSLDFYCLSSTYPGALYNSTSGLFRPVAPLFVGLQHFDREILPVVVTGAPAGVYAAASRDALGTTFTVLIANTNVTTGVWLPLNGTGVLGAGFGAQWVWNSSSNAPLLTAWVGSTPGLFWVPAGGVVMEKVAVLSSLL